MMEKATNMSKFSSCRGVSFEINSNKSTPFAALQPPSESAANDIGRWVWMPWQSGRGSTFVFPSLSRSSSNFCDLIDEEDVKNDDDVEDIKTVDLEEQQIQYSTKHEPKKKKKKKSRLSIMLLDQGIFTVYKRLFAASLALNAAALVLAAAGKFPYAKSHATVFALGNILALVICRSEAVLRVVFWLAVKALGHGFVPLRLKTAATAFLQSLGGVHSGCGVSSIAWLVNAIVLTLKEGRDSTTTEIIGIACTILALLTFSSLAAFPLLRHLHHNVFERTHRLAGWAALGLLWLFIVLTVSYDPTTKTYTSPRTKLLKTQEFYLTIAITFLILLPWLTIKQVDVAVTTPSNHASLIHFAGGVKAGVLGRISRNPLSEWHAFGIISDGETGHTMLAGAVGDFTRKLVSDPPRRLWIRSVGFSGLPYLVHMYRKVVLVATGSGICVFLSFLLQPCKDVDVCLVWVAKGIEENFGRDIKDMVSGFPAGKVTVHDAAVAGRPNVGEMAVAAARRWEADVVVVTSNPEGSRDVVNACVQAKIPAFGPIWDS